MFLRTVGAGYDVPDPGYHPSLPRMLAVDFGERRIGIAVSEGRVAVPLTIVEHENRAGDVERVAAIVRDQGVSLVVLGLPLLFSGEEGTQARRTRRFGSALSRLIQIPVAYQDERLSSVDAEQAASEHRPGRRHARRHIDDRAAAMILQAYIDAGPVTS